MNDTKKFVLPALPYNTSDLSPTISSQTVDLHYGKHHQAYFNMLNTFAEGTKFMDMDLDEVVVKSFEEDNKKVFNNAGQAWNHILYWDQMKPGGSNAPSGKLLEKINYPDSLGILYQAFTQFLGFKNYGDEYKVMGLAAFGNAEVHKDLKILSFISSIA